MVRPALVAALSILLVAVGCDRNDAREMLPSQSVAPRPFSDVTLYLPTFVTEDRAEAKPLADYLSALMKAGTAELMAEPVSLPGASGVLLVMIKPGERSRVWIVDGDPALPDALKARMIRRAEAVDPVSVRGGPVLAGLQFSIGNGGKPPPNMPMAIPRDWYALFPKTGGPLDDAFLAKVWPD